MIAGHTNTLVSQAGIVGQLEPQGGGAKRQRRVSRNEGCGHFGCAHLHQCLHCTEEDGTTERRPTRLVVALEQQHARHGAGQRRDERGDLQLCGALGDVAHVDHTWRRGIWRVE